MQQVGTLNLERALDTVELYLSDEKENDTNSEIVKFGDLYLLGKLWIVVLRTGLLGIPSKLPPLLPVVEAANPPPPPPKRPPRMKYKDLPLYESPHQEYKDFLEDQPKCPDLKRKLIHEQIVPYVKSYRAFLYNNYKDFMSEAKSMKNHACNAINSKIDEFVSYMRCGSNLQLRQGTVAFGGLAGFLYGRKYKDRLTPKLLYPAVGILAAGALCFPDETDENVRCISHYAATCLLNIYNKFCNQGFAMREKLPCRGDLPGSPQPRVANKCDKKK